MPRQNLSLNFKALNAELHASDKAADPLLVAAKITSIKVDGKDVPAAEAPLDAKIAALGSLLNAGNKTEDSANLIAANGQLAAQVEDLNGKLTVSQAALAENTAKLTAATNDLTVAQASIDKLTADKAQLNSQLEAVNKEAGRLTSELQALNTEISKQALAYGVLKVEGKDEAERLVAAQALPAKDKLTAIDGAVTHALARVGAGNGSVPNVAPKPANVSHANILAEHEAIKDPTEKIRHYRANAAAIDAAYRSAR